MNDEEFEKQRQRVRDLATWWQPKLALNEWEINHYFHRVSSDMPDGHAGQATAVCRPHWEYLLAAIHWDLSTLADVEDDMLERVFVHELMHIHLAETRAKKDRSAHQERVATELALSFVFLKKELSSSELTGIGREE